MITKADVKIGTEISCTINSTRINYAKIQIEDGDVFICQNLENGDRCRDRLGFTFSWRIGDIQYLGKDVHEFFDSMGVNNVKLFRQPDWDPEVN